MQAVQGREGASPIACKCNRRKVTVWQVEFADGTVKRVLTEGEAKDLARSNAGAVYRKVTR